MPNKIIPFLLRQRRRQSAPAKPFRGLLQLPLTTEGTEAACADTESPEGGSFILSVPTPAVSAYSVVAFDQALPIAHCPLPIAHCAERRFVHRQHGWRSLGRICDVMDQRMGKWRPSRQNGWVRRLSSYSRGAGGASPSVLWIFPPFYRMAYHETCSRKAICGVSCTGRRPPPHQWNLHRGKATILRKTTRVTIFMTTR